MDDYPDYVSERILVSPQKIRILQLLAENPATPCSLAVALRVAPATASNHLAALHGLGTVTSIARGRHRIYSISSTEFVANLQQKLDKNKR
ncbi:ArsR/SmtB family transcription factor [Pseudarthrobacter sp. YS3]|uniref:ArsR/SmtB family transcription factor n=1 Tax=Pseudarthrobacter sp. YS3 TaxID=3453718 RepID=UPI003EED5090